MVIVNRPCAQSESAFAWHSRSRFLAAGGTERNLQQTLENVPTDERVRGLDRERRSGLTQQERASSSAKTKR